MKKKQEKSGSVKIDPKVLGDAKDWCKKNGILTGYFVTQAVREKLIAEKDSRLIHS